MIQITEEIAKKANDLVARGDYQAAGYRLIIKTIEGTTEMEDAEKELYPTLAASGYQDKSKEQLEKEDIGRQYGIVVSVGDGAFKAAILGGKNWVEEGDVVYFDRYAGVHVELPPGSKKMYRIINDESILGKVEAK